MKKKYGKIVALMLAAVLLLGGCGQAAPTKEESTNGSETVAAGETEAVKETEQTTESGTEAVRETGDAPNIEGLTYESTMELTYAECFDVYYYEGGYALIDVHDSARYLVVPEGQEAPGSLDEDIIVLKQPLDRIYLAATSAMALFDSMGAMDAIRLSGTQASGWYIDHAVKAMEAGDILFAGKYSEPDYELMVDEECDLAIESTMILHSPKVQEMIEMLDIPVFIDRSSYESHPLGRTEWIKLYSVLVDKEEEAAAFFDDQAKVIRDLKDFQNTEKTVVYFYMSTDGSAVVRKASDYIPKMIEIAGGRYAFPNLEDESGKTSIPLSMEEFYATAVDADYLVYNASIDAPINSIDELMAKSELFADFKAVKEGNVWTTGKSLYQATDIVGQLIRDLNLMLTGGDASQMTFLTKVE
ncbi:ABC transporter substrate-binding protein [Fusibacillus kribbianus]|uniref:ABC transporter substrate-binding protein n=1 Tax=Fusibacillus kribbianus TaxID=3044208 RepID=A0AAP4BCZ8_9FIRM|nr:ABC transporter substrate-binding protein [Ruminococcus sp. YH-rum2234]MDI9242481.1 ABC transporter substrate-binding protein [Ruminococcus sp. YH-rum2234]